MTGAKANAYRSGLTVAGIGTGALVGAKAGAAIGSIGGPVGTLIGAGLGTAVGWFAGDKIARNIEAAKYESEELKAAIKDADTSAEELSQTFEKAVYENMKKHFGDIKLSLSEIERLTDQIVWGDDIGNFDKFTTATQTAEANLQSMKSAAEKVEKWMWKASLGVKFNEDERESIVASFEEYINSAKSFVENKHYEFTAAVSLLVDVESKGGKNILESGNSFYGKMMEELDKAGKTLGDKLSKALEDGIINADEQKAISAAQQKIAEITEKIANAEQKAELELIKVKFGNGKLDLDSFENFMSQMQTTIDERMNASDKAFVASVSSLNLQLAEGAITKEEYDKQINDLINGYTGTVEKLQAEIKDVELSIIGDAYADELGKGAKEKLEKALNEALKTGIDPIEWSDEELAKLLGVDNLSGDAAGAIKKMLSGVVSQIEILEVDGKIYASWDVENKEDPEQKIKDKLPETVETTVGVNISGEKNIQTTIDILAEDFGIPPEHAATVALLLTGDKELLNKIDVSQLAKEFGIPESQAKKIIEKLTGEKSIENRLTVLSSDFGIPDSISKTISVNLTAIKGKISNLVGNVFGGGKSKKKGGAFRGGIFGYSDGGYVAGGSQLIRVAEEGDPEVIIPLSPRRRDRAMELWEQTGNLINAKFGGNYATGGYVGSKPDGFNINKEDVHIGGGVSGEAQTIKIDVGGIELNVRVEGGQDVVAAIQDQKEELADEIAGIIEKALAEQFRNMPRRKGA